MSASSKDMGTGWPITLHSMVILAPFSTISQTLRASFRFFATLSSVVGSRTAYLSPGRSRHWLAAGYPVVRTSLPYIAPATCASSSTMGNVFMGTGKGGSVGTVGVYNRPMSSVSHKGEGVAALRWRAACGIQPFLHIHHHNVLLRKDIVFHAAGVMAIQFSPSPTAYVPR